MRGITFVSIDGIGNDWPAVGSWVLSSTAKALLIVLLKQSRLFFWAFTRWSKSAYGAQSSLPIVL